MNKHIKILQSQKGQSLILIAAVMTGLIALTGLAVDGGNFFLERRNTQNAADAAAMAGTRLLAKAICSEPGANDAAIAEEVNRYVQLNDIQDLSGVTAFYVGVGQGELGQVGGGSVPVGAMGVAVKIDNSFGTYFIRVVGINDVTVSASATALTGPPLTAGGLRPIGVPLELVLALDEGDPFRLGFGNCTNKPEDCIAQYTGGQVQHRGWLNLAYAWNKTEDPDWPRALDPSGDANVLKTWMENGYPNGVDFYYGDYIHAKPGRNSSVIGQAPVGEKILVPIFDAVPHYDQIPAPKAPKASQGGGYYYHIVGFVAFKVTGANQGAGTIDGEFVKAYIGDGQVSSAAGLGFGEAYACQTHVQAINLWR